MRGFVLGLILSLSLISSSQVINTSFIAPDTICVNQTFTIQNTSTGSISSSYWNFCTSSVVLTQSVNLGTSASSFPVFMTINNDAGNYYAFVSHNFPGGMSRFNFGNSLNNIPTSVNLGNFGGNMPGNSEGIVIEQEGSNWFGVVVGGPAGTIAKMSFGTSLANLPTVVNLGNIGTLAYPHRLKIIHSGGNKYGFTVNRSGNTITRFDFGNSLNNTPSGTNLGNLGGLSSPNDFDIVYVNGNWYMFITNDGNNTLTRLDFGNSLLNTPTGTNLGTIGVSPLRGISIDITCGGIKGQVTSQSNTYANLNFPTGPMGPVTTSFVGNTGFSFPHSIEKYRVGDTVYAFVPNANSNSLTRLKYANCSISSVPNSTLANLSPITINSPGVYTISLLNNSNQYNQSVNCKTIAVVGNSITVNASPNTGCSPGFTSTLTVSGFGTFTWNPGSIVGNTIVVTPTASTIYTTITSSTLNCGGSQTLSLNVIVTPTLNVSATNFSICSGKSTSLSASGASSYTWNPGNFVASGFTIAPSSTTIYTVTGSNGICTDTKTIQIDVSPSPTVIISPSPSTVCLNSTTTLTANGASNFTWSPNIALSSTNTPVTFANPTVTTTYSVIGATGACTNLASVQVSVVSLPTVTVAQPSQTICLNKIATITANGATSYTWNPGNFSGSSVTVSPLSNTIYTVIGTVGSCTGFATATINTLVNPTITANASTVNICSGKSVTLTSSGASTYTWNPGNLIGTTVTASPIATTVFSVTGTNSLGCTDAAAITVSVVSNPTVSILNLPGIICSGDQGSLEGSGANTYTWLPTLSSNTNIVVTPSTTTTYTLIGQIGACVGSAVTTITVNPYPNLTAVAINPSICATKSTTLLASGASSYSWQPINAFSSSVIVTPTINTTYTVTGTSLNCSITKTLDVTVISNPTIQIQSSPNLICLNSSQTSTLFASGADTYLWLPNSSISTSVTVSPTVSSIYTVTGTNSFGCFSFNTIALNVNPDLISSISATHICLGQSVELMASGALSYIWSPGNFNLSVVNLVPDGSTTYTVVGTTGLCSRTGTVSVETVNSPIHEIPEVFTPNDDGKNDKFVIKSEIFTKINLKVFNRWGALVYSHPEYDNNWDGTANSGLVFGNNKLPQGTYYYVIDLESCDKQVVRGYVVIQY
jgi:gliding motility-associated-like protein